MKNYKSWVLLIILLATSLRVINIDSPFSGHHAWKETQFAGMAYVFMYDGIGDFITPRNFEMGPHNNVFPIPAWLIMIFWSMFGVYEWAARLPFIILGVLSVCILFKITKMLYSEKIALLSMFFLAISPMHVYFSRNTQPESVLIFLMLVSVYYFVRYIKLNKNKYIMLSSLFLSLATLEKYIALFLLVSYSLYLFLYEKGKLNLKIIILCLATIIIPTLLWINHGLNLKECVWSHISFSSFSDIFNYNFYILKLSEIAYGLNPLTFLFAILFFILFLSNFKNETVDFVLLWILGGFLYLIGVIPIAYGNNYYVLPLIPPFCIVSALGFQRIKNFNIKLISILLILLVSIIFIGVVYSIRYPYYETGLYLREKTNANEEIFWTESPVICYYAKRYCIEGNLENLKLRKDIKYLPIHSASYDLLSEEYNNYVEKNFILDKKLFGRQNIIGRNFMIKNEKEYVLIYKRKD